MSDKCAGMHAAALVKGHGSESGRTRPTNRLCKEVLQGHANAVGQGDGLQRDGRVAEEKEDGGVEREAADDRDVRERGGTVQEQRDVEVVLPCVGDEVLRLVWVRDLVLEPVFLQLHTTEAGEESAKGIEKLGVGVGVARNGPNDEFLDIWEVPEELDDAGIQFIDVRHGLLVQPGLYDKPTDVYAQVGGLLQKSSHSGGLEVEQREGAKEERCCDFCTTLTGPRRQHISMKLLHANHWNG